jgi:hypothetical protein
LACHAMAHAPDDLVAPAPAPRNTALRTALFFAIVGGVLATFIVLGRQGKPPTMPHTDPHRLQLNLKGELVGVVGEAGLAEAMLPGVELDKRSVEKRVNTSCQTCHGSPGDDPASHACGVAGRCLPKNHPPKPECIKCHRVPAPAVP